VCVRERERDRKRLACKTDRVWGDCVGFFTVLMGKKTQQKTNGLRSETSGSELNLSHIDYY